METIKFNSKGSDVRQLQVMLNTSGYRLAEDGIFGNNLLNAVKDFQTKNQLEATGLVGEETWTLLSMSSAPKLQELAAKSLKEEDIETVAEKLRVEPAVVKAVHRVESNGQGFLSDARPQILFEGHIFWGLIRRSGQNPEKFTAGNDHILYPKWVTGHYKGSFGEYDRLEQAAMIPDLPNARALALKSASWGLFQIMGYHATTLGYSDAEDFVTKLSLSEGEQLEAFNRFIEANGLAPYLRKKDWAGFAYRYNGAGYKENRYDAKLRKAYEVASAAAASRGMEIPETPEYYSGRPLGIDKEWF